MKFNKKKGRFLEEVINRWETDGTIDSEMAAKLRGSYSHRPFDWKRMARYSFWIAILCAIISVGAAVADEALLKMIERFFATSYIGLCLIFAGIAVVIYFIAFLRRKRLPEKIFSNESIIFAGVLCTAVSIGYFVKAVDNGSGHFSVLFLIATCIYALLGLWFPSTLVWIFALVSLGSWFGTETGYRSGWGPYYHGMNYPLRFVFFGAALVILAFIMKNIKGIRGFFRSTYVVGLLYMFIALWILSIFGNYGDIDKWYGVRQRELFTWSILFGVVTLSLIFYGLWADDYTARIFGITFLFINLYTRYFEYFWNGMHKAVFFIILAISFWLIGQQAERVWTLEFLKRDQQPEPGKK